MTVKVSDSRSNPKDQIAHAAEVLGRSQKRRKVFEAIFHGKKRIKTVEEICKNTNLSRKQVLKAGKHLAKNDIVHQTKMNGDTAYEKDDFYQVNKATILRLADDRNKLKTYPTKVNPRVAIQVETIRLPAPFVRIRQITVDDIDSFENVRTVEELSALSEPPLERIFKEGVQKILREFGAFTDWGGEKNDLFTTRLVIDGKRLSTAMAFKGRGTTGKLTPGKLGKNGDQIQRLFQSSANVFLIQYYGQIDESVLDQMTELAKAKSVSAGQKILFGLIDKADTTRIINAYPKCFQLNT